MIPIRDENPARRVPWVNYLFIGANVLVWGWQLLGEMSGATWLSAAYGVVPRRILMDPAGEAFTILMSMFMHGGWGHLGGNLLFLYIFGDNVEDALGHGRYVLYYLTCGLLAALAQIFIESDSTIPMVGASGAIAGVLGGYMVLYPRAPITVLNPIFPLWFLLGPLLVFPAWLVMGEWFVWNLVPGLASLGGSSQGGVAFFAHIGGFLAGLVLVKPMVSAVVAQPRTAWAGWRAPPRSRGNGSGSDGWIRRGGGSRRGGFYD